MSGSGISWAICKSAPRSRQITMPAPHHSVFLQAGCPSCRPTNSVKTLKAKKTDQSPGAHFNGKRLRRIWCVYTSCCTFLPLTKLYVVICCHSFTSVLCIRWYLHNFTMYCGGLIIIWHKCCRWLRGKSRNLCWGGVHSTPLSLKSRVTL